MSPEEFDSIVEGALRRIPPRFRRRLNNVAIVVEPEPPRPNLLGLYHGVPLTESYAMTPTASVSGLYFGHPDARYFSVGRS